MILVRFGLVVVGYVVANLIVFMLVGVVIACWFVLALFVVLCGLLP